MFSNFFIEKEIRLEEIGFNLTYTDIEPNFDKTNSAQLNQINYHNLKG